MSEEKKAIFENFSNFLNVASVSIVQAISMEVIMPETLRYVEKALSFTKSLYVLCIFFFISKRLKIMTDSFFVRSLTIPIYAGLVFLNGKLPENIDVPAELDKKLQQAKQFIEMYNEISEEDRRLKNPEYKLIKVSCLL